MIRKLIASSLMSFALAFQVQAQPEKSTGRNNQDAELSLVNKTASPLKIKVMDRNTSRLYGIADVAPHGTAVVDIGRNGKFYVMASAYDGSRPVYVRTLSSQFQCDAQGYTQAEMTFTMVTSVTDSEGNAVERTLSARITRYCVVSRIAEDDGRIYGKSITANEFNRD